MTALCANYMDLGALRAQTRALCAIIMDIGALRAQSRALCAVLYRFLS